MPATKNEPTDVSVGPDLAEALTNAGYRYDDVAALLGTTAHVALSRNETTPGERATRGGSPLETLVRLWLLQLPSPQPPPRTPSPAWSTGSAQRRCSSGPSARWQRGSTYAPTAPTRGTSGWPAT